ncbi:MAG: 50S ribosomal protein L11 methyltransferase [Prevotella sp.]|nr:50S ribosomal protein L11 methyltransferase [Prevotella sp.]
MKYFEVKFTLSPYSTDASDVLSAMAGEAGFESFEETSDGLLGYVQQQLYSAEALQEVLSDFPFEEVSITYDVREAEDRDWNEQWEQEGFEPIVISRKEEGYSRSEECGVKSENTFEGIIIHDGRHLPTELSSLHTPHSSFLEIEIDARQAFGTGTHETTRMICAEIIQYASGARILDCGTGTGILSICALKLGASEAIGYDIDEWSVDNARHNAVINHVDDRFTSLLGDATILNKVEGTFNLVLANINRNILLNDLPQFRQKMAPGACLILSGFYTADTPLLIEKAATLGLTLQQQKEENDWACLIFK